MKKTSALVLLAALCVPGGAAAQTEGRFRTGIVTWTPTVTLRDAGLDSNVYDEAANPRRDYSAVFGPQVDGLIRLTATDIRFGGGADFVYFQRYTGERSVNTRGNVRVDLRTLRVRPFGTAAVLDARERVNSEIDVRARRSDRDFGAGLTFELTSRGSLEVAGTFGQSSFRQGEVFQGVDLAHRLNRRATGARMRFKYEATALTRIVAEASTSQDRFTLSPAFDTDNLTGRVGVEFEPDAVLKGRATIGYHRMQARGALSFPFEGMTAAVDLGYVLFQRTRFDVRVARDTSYSFERQPYFLQTVYGGEILHTLFAPVDVFARGSWETLDYPGISERAIAADQLEVTRYGGGLALRPGTRVGITFNYEVTERTGQVVVDRRYDRYRLYTNITYGF